MLIKSKKDAQIVVNNLQGDEILHLYPDGQYGNLQVCITKTGCREFWNGEIGVVGEDDPDSVVNMLYKYRKAYNSSSN